MRIFNAQILEVKGIMDLDNDTRRTLARGDLISWVLCYDGEDLVNSKLLTSWLWDTYLGMLLSSVHAL